jgi:hypothetical protein
MIVAHGRRVPAPRAKSAPAAAVNAAPPLPFELAALAGIVDAALLDAGARRAERLGMVGDEVLRTHNIISANALVAALATHLGLEIDTLEDGPPPETAPSVNCRLTRSWSRSTTKRTWSDAWSMRSLGKN